MDSGAQPIGRLFASGYVDQGLEDGLYHSSSALRNGASPTSRLRNQLSRQQWEELKPLIRRLYIDENKTLSYIARTLAESHNFRPTKKQFTTKITEWGLKKNTKRSEREHVLQGLGPLEGDIRIDLKGRHFREKKLLRWDKERRREQATPSSFTNHSVTLNNTNDSLAFEPQQLQQGFLEDSDTTMKADVEVADAEVGAPTVERDPLPRVWMRSFEDEEYRLLPRSQWMDADILNSPNLTRLLKGLNLEGQNISQDIEPLLLSSPFVEPGGFNKDYVSCSDLFLRPEDTIAISQLLGDEDSYSESENYAPGFSSQIQRQNVVKSTIWPYTHHGGEAWFPSGIRMDRCPSPFNELYPFPPNLYNAILKATTLSFSRQSIAERVQRKLAQLQRAGVSAKHPGILGLINRLADIAYDSGKMTEAITLYKKVISSQGGDIMMWSEKALHAQIGLIDGLCREGHPLEAKVMLESVSQAMSQRFDPTHIIFRRLQKARIEIFNWMEDWEKEEPVVRDLVQICLVNLGPRDPETLNALYRLASVMMGKSQCSRSEKLHRTTIQLCKDGTEKHQERMCWSFVGLGRVYESQGRLDDAIKLLEDSSRRSTESLGNENEAVMISNYRLARILARRGLLEESEDLLHKTLKLQIKVLGEAHINPMCTMFELGWTLQQRKQYAESAHWLEKAFRNSLTLSNFEFITRFCKGLGSCYEEQGQYSKALGSYYEALVFLEAAKSQGDDGTFDVDQYVVKIRALIDQACMHVDGEASQTNE